MSAFTERGRAFNLEFGANVQERMAASGITLWGLSRKTGIPYSTLARKITEGTRVTVVDVVIIARALNVEPSDLLPSTVAHAA